MALLCGRAIVIISRTDGVSADMWSILRVNLKNTYLMTLQWRTDYVVSWYTYVRPLFCNWPLSVKIRPLGLSVQ